MRGAALAVSSILGTAMIVWAAFALGGDVPPPAGVLVLVSLLVLWAVGLLSGIVVVGEWWDPATADGRADRRRFFVVAAIVGVLAAALLAAQAVTGAAPSDTVTVGLALGVAYVVLSVSLGRFVRRREEAARGAAVTIGASRAVLLRDLTRRKADNVALWFAITLVVSVGIAVLVDQLLLMDPARVLLPLSVAVSLAALVGMVVCATVAMSFYGPARDLLGSDRARNRRIRRAVLSARPVDLTDDERDIAAEYAPLAAEVTAWNLGQNVFLFVALLAQNVPRSSDPVAFSLSVLLLAGIVVAIVIGRRERRNARRFEADPAVA